MKRFYIAWLLVFITTQAFAQQAPQTLRPVGTISGNFDCFDNRQLRLSLDQEGKTQLGKSVAQNGEVVELWQDKNNNFTVIFAFPGMAATCVMIKGQFTKQ